MNLRCPCRESGWVRILTPPRATGKGPSELYAWNTAVSAAFYGPLQGLEVTLRNAIHCRLADRHGEAWYDNPDAGLDRGAVERIASARTELARDGHGDAPSRIVAALSFGFWVSLLGPGGRMAGGRKAKLRDDTLVGGAAQGVCASHDIDPQGGPPAVEWPPVGRPRLPPTSVDMARKSCREGALEVGGAGVPEPAQRTDNLQQEADDRPEDPIGHDLPDDDGDDDPKRRCCGGCKE